MGNLPDALEHFEKEVRPIFVQNCQGCHNEKTKNGGLNLRSAEGLKEAAAGGFFGAAAEPNKAIIMQALSYDGRIKMPPQGKLPGEKIAAIREWIGNGAPTPVVESAMGVRAVATRGVITEADRNFWSFRPIAKANPPSTAKKNWAANDIDRFILGGLEKNGLEPPHLRTRMCCCAVRLSISQACLPPKRSSKTFYPTSLRARSRKSLTGCSPRPDTVSVGAATGWT